MKLSKTQSKLKSRIQTVFISLALMGFFSIGPVYSDSINSMEIKIISDNLTNIHKTSNTNNVTPIANDLPDKKKILIDESRGLSAFFIFGIVINIIMAVTFAWWFSRQWRQTKK